MRRNADNALARWASSRRETRDAAVRGGAAVGNVVKSMSDVATTSARVVDVVTVIDEIAFRTNLLALNAAVEAAHAGDHGRGFAVVASEVRALSQRCTVSAHEIKQLIDASNQTVRQGTALVASAGQTIQDVVDRVATMAGVVGEIARDAQQQCADIDGVARKIAEVETSNRENAACWSGRATVRANCSCWPGARRRGGRFHIDGRVPPGSGGRTRGLFARRARLIARAAAISTGVLSRCGPSRPTMGSLIERLFGIHAEVEPEQVHLHAFLEAGGHADHAEQAGLAAGAAGRLAHRSPAEVVLADGRGRQVHAQLGHLAQDEGGEGVGVRPRPDVVAIRVRDTPCAAASMRSMMASTPGPRTSPNNSGRLPYQ